VNGTFIRDLEEFLLLFFVEISRQMNLALDSIDLAFLRFAVPAIRRVNLRVAKIHRHTLERPLLRPRVPRDGHRRAGTQGGEKQIIGRRPGIFPADFDWLVRAEPMRTDNDLLGKSRRVAAYDYIRGIHASRLRPVSITRQPRCRSAARPKTPGDPAHNPLQWANQANIAFNKKTKSLLVTNHASLTGLPDPSFLFAVFDVYVKDKAGKLFKSDDDED